MQLRRFPTSSGELLFGQIPSVAELKTLKKQKIDAIWNLAQELSVLVPYEKLYANEVLFGNISDFGIPKGDAFIGQLNRVVALLKQGKKVFVHCFGGHGRTGTALAAIDVALNGRGSKEALSNAFTYARGPETPEQDEYVELLDTLYNNAPKKPKKKKKDMFTGNGDYEQLWEELVGRREKRNQEPLPGEYIGPGSKHYKPFGKEIDLSKWPEEDYSGLKDEDSPAEAAHKARTKAIEIEQANIARKKYLESLQNVPLAVPVDDDDARKRREERFDAIQKKRLERGLAPLPDRFRGGPKK